MSTGRRRGRPTIHEQAMTPTERQQRWRAKVKAAEIRASRAEWSVAPPPPRYRHKEPPVVMGELVMERQADVTLGQVVRNCCQDRHNLHRPARAPAEHRPLVRT